jgi:hypothetical protein
MEVDQPYDLDTQIPSEIEILISEDDYLTLKKLENKLAHLDVMETVLFFILNKLFF